jgi:hypothetical protein
MGRPATARLRAMVGHEHVHVYVQSSGTTNDSHETVLRGVRGLSM